MRTVLALVVLLVLAALVFFVLEPDDADQNAEVTTESGDVSSDGASGGNEAGDGDSAAETAASTQSDDGDDSSDTTVSDADADTSDTAAQATQTDDDTASGQEAEGSEPATDEAATNVETEVAAIPDETSGDAAVEPVTPSFDIVRVETSGDAVMAGRAAPGATVQIYSHDGLVAETTADERGDWVVVLEEPLAAGSHELWLKSLETNGAVSESRESVAMLVPEAGETPSASTETQETSETASAAGDTDQTGTADDGADETIAVLVPRDDDGKVEILQEPEDGVGLAGGDGLSLDTLDYDEAGEVSLSGKAEPGAEIRAYVDGELVGRTLADSAGNWRMMLEKPVEQGLHALRIDQVDEEGIVLGRVETPFDRESLQLPSSAEPLVIIQPGNNLWTIARHSYGSGVHYTHIFEANQGQIADPHLIYPGQIFVLPTIN